MPDGTIIEIQHSDISIHDIEQRELFYGNNRLFDLQEGPRRGQALNVDKIEESLAESYYGESNGNYL